MSVCVYVYGCVGGYYGTYACVKVVCECCVCVCYVCDGMTNDVQSYVRTFWRALWRHLGGGTWLKALENTPGIGQAVSSDASHIVSRSPSSADVGESRSTSCNGTSLLLSPPYCE